MPIQTYQIPSGSRVIIRTCEGCGSTDAPYGTGRLLDALRSGDPSKVKCWCGPDGCKASETLTLDIVEGETGKAA